MNGILKNINNNIINNVLNYILLLFLAGGGVVSFILTVFQILQNVWVFNNLLKIKHFLAILPIHKWSDRIIITLLK